MYCAPATWFNGWMASVMGSWHWLRAGNVGGWAGKGGLFSTVGRGQGCAAILWLTPNEQIACCSALNAIVKIKLFATPGRRNNSDCIYSEQFIYIWIAQNTLIWVFSIVYIYRERERSSRQLENTNISRMSKTSVSHAGRSRNLNLAGLNLDSAGRAKPMTLKLILVTFLAWHTALLG